MMGLVHVRRGTVFHTEKSQGSFEIPNVLFVNLWSLYLQSASIGCSCVLGSFLVAAEASSGQH